MRTNDPRPTLPKPRTDRLLLPLAFGSLLMAPACGGDSAENVETRGIPPLGLFAVRLTDAPGEGIVEAWVTIEALEARRCGGDTPWVDVPVVDVQYDLLALRDGVSAPLTPASWLAPGTYCELRLVVAEGSNYVVLDDLKSRPLKVPSGDIKLKTSFEVAGGLATELTIDIDAAKSIKSAAGGETYIMHPVVQVKEIHYAPISGALGDGHDYIGSTSFEVNPWLGGVYDLGGATIWFPPGSVADFTWFTATRWRHRSDAAIGDLYHFYPPYEFDVEPVLSISHTPDPNHEFSVFVDGWELLSDESQETIVETDVPHFCGFEAGPNFVDVSDNHAFAWYVNRMACEGIMSGYSDKHFRPEQTINRAEFLKIVALSVTQPSELDALAGGVKEFDDVELTDWFHPYVKWAKAVGIIDPAPLFRPADPVNRAEAAKILLTASRVYDGESGGAGPRLRDLHAYMTTGAVNRDDEVFSDLVHDAQANSHPWYYAHAYAARAANLMGSHDGAAFDGGALLTRAEAAKLLCVAGGHCSLRELQSRLFCSEASSSCDAILAQIDVTLDFGDSVGDGINEGVDFSGSFGVFAPSDGEISSIDANCGRVTIADSRANVEHVLEHVALEPGLVLGKWLKRGASIGTALVENQEGCVSFPTGLHYELRQRQGGVALNPYTPPVAPRAVPAEWRQIGLSSPAGGIQFYQRGDAQEFVTVLDLRRVMVKLLTGALQPSGYNDGNHVIWKQTHTKFYTIAQAIDPQALRVVFGGAFGSNAVDPTGVAFGLTVDGTLVSSGYGAPGAGNEYPKETKVIAFNNDEKRAWVGPYHFDPNGPDPFDTSPDVIGGLDSLTRKGADENWRTMLGVRDDDGDGDFETVVVFSCKMCEPQKDVPVVLEAFGAAYAQQIQFDGSGSTFLFVDGVEKIAANRKIPQATAFYLRP